MPKGQAVVAGFGQSALWKSLAFGRFDLALDRFQDGSRSLLTQLVTLTQAEILLSSLCINGEEFINGCYQPNGSTIVGMSFHRLEEVSPGVCPTTGMGQFRATHSIIAAGGIGL